MSCGFWSVCEDGDSGLGGSFLLGVYSLSDIFTGGDSAARFYADGRSGGDAQRRDEVYGAATEAFADVNYWDFSMTIPNAAQNWAADFTFGDGGAEYLRKQEKEMREAIADKGLAGALGDGLGGAGNALKNLDGTIKWLVAGAAIILAIKVVGIVK